MRLHHQVLTAAVMGIMGLTIYEGARLWRAEAATPRIIAAHEDDSLHLAQLSDERRSLLLTVEDPDFYHHHGVDLATPGQGMTTITQALVKRLYFKEFHAGFEKIEQSLIARFVLDPAVSKDRQLEMLLNCAYFGDIDGKPVIGFEEAAALYFNTSFEALTDDEFLSLVAMLVAPNALDPARHATENAERVARIKRLIAHQCAPDGWLDVWYENCAPDGKAADSKV